MTQQTLTQSERQGYVQSQHVLSKQYHFEPYYPTALCFIAAQFQFAKKGSLWTAPSMEWFNGMVFFGRNNKNRSSVFRKLLFFAVCFD